jgi:hypothetical protein
MLLTAPLTWPIGKLLDATLGEESALFKRRELKALVSIHADQPVRRGRGGKQAAAAVMLQLSRAAWKHGNFAASAGNHRSISCSCCASLPRLAHTQIHMLQITLACRP